jgi:hypothetical protein
MLLIITIPGAYYRKNHLIQARKIELDERSDNLVIREDLGSGAKYTGCSSRVTPD